MDAFTGEIRVFPYDFAPKGWAQCNGQILSINQNQALFSLLGVTHGGNGTTTFQLPDMRGRTMLGAGSGNGLDLALGSVEGTAKHALQITELPAHIHQMQAVDALATANVGTGGTTYLAQLSIEAVAAPHTSFAANGYIDQLTAPVTLASGSVADAGSGTPHENRQPYQTLNVCICLSGFFPSRN